MSKITIYPNVLCRGDTGDLEKKEVSLDVLHFYITDGSNNLDQKTVQANRLAQGDEDVYKKFKVQLPAISFAGTFSQIPPVNESLLEHSGLVVIDYDDVPDVGDLKRQLAELPTVRFVYVSPSGRGVKAVVEVDPVPTSQDEHEAAFEACKEALSHIDGVIDEGGSDVRRFSFAAHDPLAHYRPEGVAIQWEHHVPDDVVADTTPRPVHNPAKIDLSVLNYLDPDDYNSWIQVGMVIKDVGLGVDVWIEWSKTSDKFTAGQCEKKWKTFKKRKGWGSLVHEANAVKKKLGIPITAPTTPQEQPEGDVVPAVVNIVDESNEEEVPLVLPDSVFTGIFADYADAYKGRTEAAREYHFACLYTAIGAVVGRRYYIDEVHRVYPNAFTALVGQTALARKTTALNCIRQLLEQASPDVYNLTALSTPEGLLNMFCYNVPDEDEEDEDTTSHILVGDQMRLMHEACIDDEGFRIFLTLDEIAKMLRKASSASSTGLMEMLADMFGYPSRVQLPTRTNPLSAENPCLTILGATTYEWFESAFQEEDIHGGIANRFLYFYNPPRTERLFITQPADKGVLQNIAKELNGLRRKFGTDTNASVPFTWSPEAIETGEMWYQEMCQIVDAEENVFVAHAQARSDLYLKKSALLHAILFNESDNTVIGEESMMWAIDLMGYLIETTREIYEEFNTSHKKRIEERIIYLLQRKPWMTVTQQFRQMRWATRTEIGSVLDALFKTDTVTIMETSQSKKYAVVADE